MTDKRIDCGSIAPVEQWLKFAEQWAYSRSPRVNKLAAAVASVMFQDDSWLPDSESEQ